MLAPLPRPAPVVAPVLQDHTSRLAEGWTLLHEAGRAVAGLAQLGEEALSPEPEAFAARAVGAGDTRRALAEQAIDDCCAALHTGLSALVATIEAGRDSTAAALTLWREFDRAREALLAITAPVH